jgi:transposase
MPNKKIPPRKVKKMIVLNALQGINKADISKLLNLSKGTVKKYIKLYENSDISGADIFSLSDKELIKAIVPGRESGINKRQLTLENQLREVHDRHQQTGAHFKQLWEEYRQQDLSAYGYSQFMARYHRWRETHDFEIVTHNRWQIDQIAEEDAAVLADWRRSTDRAKWERAVAILDLHKGVAITKVSRKIERSPRTIQKWRARFLEDGIVNLDLRRSKQLNTDTVEQITIKKKRLVKLIHESPQLHDINRTSWSLLSLAQAYGKVYGESISKSTISEYIRSEGYTFKKAKKVLTSPDPDYRPKLEKITAILRKLKSDEKFFSIDEFGPVAIKIRGGKALCRREEMRTIPQRQTSKGHLICTAALELSTNQITHFYSTKKNTQEMIRLLDALLEKYKSESCIFFSWDAASWHASKMLYKRVEEVNNPEYRTTHNTPLVELAPLPSSAQFLNVIESVFSGLAKAVIHNSDYKSVEECKCAIDRYFLERNLAFKENPKRAGKKIWGEEVVKPVFDDANICKDRRWR